MSDINSNTKINQQENQQNENNKNNNNIDLEGNFITNNQNFKNKIQKK